jgi:hypothetical protein
MREKFFKKLNIAAVNSLEKNGGANNFFLPRRSDNSNT